MSGNQKREYPNQPIATALAVVFNGDKMLLIKRSKEPSLGKWSLPGGRIELGETIVDAAKRETFEETQVETDVLKLIDVADGIIRDDIGRIRFHYIGHYVLSSYRAGDAKAASDAADTKWVEKDQIEKLDMNPLVRRIIMKAFDMKAECDRL